MDKEALGLALHREPRGAYFNRMLKTHILCVSIASF